MQATNDSIGQSCFTRQCCLLPTLIVSRNSYLIVGVLKRTVSRRTRVLDTSSHIIFGCFCYPAVANNGIYQRVTIRKLETFQYFCMFTPASREESVEVLRTLFGSSYFQTATCQLTVVGTNEERANRLRACPILCDWMASRKVLMLSLRQQDFREMKVFWYSDQVSRSKQGSCLQVRWLFLH